MIATDYLGRWMTQLSLFENPKNIVRKCDPETSHMAAVQTESKRSGAQATMELVMGRAVSPRTAQELASECVRLFGGMAETYRKRAHELVELGRAAECEARRCGITGKMATTFRRVTQ